MFLKMFRVFRKIDIVMGLLIVIGALFIFRDIFLHGKILFPSNFLVNFYSPWATEKIEGWDRGIPNKPIGDDQIRIFFPSRSFSNEMINKKSLPLWNPYIFSGTPHIADFQSAVFYPLNILYLFLPQIPVWSFLLIIQPLMATFFTFFYLKHLKLESLSAWFGAIAFGFSGFILVWSQENVVVGQAALWLPLALLGIDGFLVKNARLYYLVAVFALACSFLAGFFQVTFYIFAFTFFYSLFRIFSLKNVNKFRSLLFIFSIYLFALSLSSIQLFPSLEAFPYSPRSIVSAWYLFELYLLPVTHIFNALAPDIFGNPAVYNFFGRGFYRETILYIGVVPLIFALYSIFKPKTNHLTYFFLITTFVTLFLGLNSPFTRWFFTLPLPLLPTFLPSRIFILTSFSLAVLSAFSFSGFIKSENKLDRKFVFLILIIMLLLLLICIYIFASFYMFDHFNKNNLPSQYTFESLNKYMIREDAIPQKTDIMVMLRNLFLPFIMVFLLGILAIFKKRQGAVISIVILTLIGQLYFLNKYSVVGDPQFIYPKNPVLSFLKSKNSVDRFLSFGQPIHENTSILNHIYSVEGVNPIFPSKYGQLLFAVRNKGKITNNIPRVEARLSELDVDENPFQNSRRLRLLSLLGVKHILYYRENKPSQNLFSQSLLKPVWNQNNWYAYEYTNVLPRAFLASNIYIEKDPQKTLDLIFNPNLDLSQNIILEEKPSELLSIQKNPIHLVNGSKNSFVEIKKYEPQKIEIYVKTDQSQMLFLSDNYFPGWKAYIDGKETKIYRADYTFRGIFVTPGEHTITYRYQPLSIKLGAAISLFSVTIFFLIAFSRKKFVFK